MGTNFYAHIKPSKEQHEEMVKLLNQKQYEQLKEMINDVMVKYHIGKRSYGWQFLFSPHKSKNAWEQEMPWENTLQSIKDFLAREDVEICDEYGTQFTPEQFWDEEIGDSLYNDPEKYINVKQYYESGTDGLEHAWWVKPEDHEFITKEGLRFSTTPEFS